MILRFNCMKRKKVVPYILPYKIYFQYIRCFHLAGVLNWRNKKASCNVQDAFHKKGFLNSRGFVLLRSHWFVAPVAGWASEP